MIRFYIHDVAALILQPNQVCLKAKVTVIISPASSESDLLNMSEELSKGSLAYGLSPLCEISHC